MPKRVLVVCSGNICRSPMAEGILRSLVEAAGIGWEVRSAGTLGFVGSPPADLAIRACRERGVDISGLRSDALTPELLRWADVALGMERGHVRACERLGPASGARVDLLGAYGATDEIEDPIGKDLEAFRECRDRIFTCIEHFVRQELAPPAK